MDTIGTVGSYQDGPAFVDDGGLSSEDENDGEDGEDAESPSPLSLMFVPSHPHIPTSIDGNISANQCGSRVRLLRLEIQGLPSRLLSNQNHHLYKHDHQIRRQY